MKHLFILFIGLITCNFSSFSQGKLKAYIDQKNFYSPEIGHFSELHFQFVSYTLNYMPVEGGLQAKVAVQVVVRNTANDTVFKDGFALESPVMRDSIIEDFYDVMRLPVSPGNYSISVSLQDLVTNTDPMLGQLELSVDDLQKNISQSDIVIAELAVKTGEPTVFSKSGYDIIPRISNYYPADLTSMPYYLEVYNTPLLNDTTFGISQRIINVQNEQEIPEFSRLTKLKTQPVMPFLRNLDISKLPSGSYRLETSIVNRKNEIQGNSSNYYFERLNELEQFTTIAEIVLDPTFQASITDDSLRYYLSSLIPISRPAEVRSIIETLKTAKNENCRKHIQQFWLQTSGTNATESWRNYKEQVLIAQKFYGNNFQDGHETDRGRVYLQYGPPNTITTRENSPTEYPYEIWHYYKIKQFSNKRFVFYNPDLVNNGYRLLHSDLIGEPQNYRWQQTLSKRTTNNSNLDDPNDGLTPTYGGNSNYYYKQD